MKFLLVSAATFAMAVAGPIKQTFVQPAPDGPATVINLDQLETIAIGPAIVDNFEPIAIGPTIVDNFEPVVIGTAIVNPARATANPSASAPLVQIILMLQDLPLQLRISPAPPPVQVVNEAIIPDPVIDVDKPIVTLPVIVVDKPIIPKPVTVIEKASAPEIVIITVTIIPAPDIVLPEILN